MAMAELGSDARHLGPRQVPVLVRSSVTAYRLEEDAGAVGVCGSHGAPSAVAYGARAGLVGLIVNDAGVGRKQAGIAGLEVAAGIGFPVAAVSHMTARIGDGEDTYSSGLVSHVNQPAATLGVEPGMRAADAAELLRSGTGFAAWPSDDGPHRSVVEIDGIEVLCSDSAANIANPDSDRVLVTGSHGGTVGGRTLVNPVLAAFFNDAGIGKESAGVSRVYALQNEGVPAGAVSHMSAMIGDAEESLHHGVLSVVNDLARNLGVLQGTTILEAIGLLADSYSSSKRRER